MNNKTFSALVYAIVILASALFLLDVLFSSLELHYETGWMRLIYLTVFAAYLVALVRINVHHKKLMCRELFRKRKIQLERQFLREYESFVNEYHKKQRS